MSEYTSEQIIEKVKKGESLEGLDLTHIKLKEIDMNKIDLSGTNLSRANLSGANLSGANLRRANLFGADLRKTNLSSANLFGTHLRSAYLRRANLSDASLRRADLRRADLRRANLSGAYLSDADLSGADLFGADLRRTNLKGVNLYSVDLSETFLYKTKFREEDLSGAKYRPEQLKDMIIERPEKEPLIVPEQKSRLGVRFTEEKPPLLHLIYMAAFLEYQYDILYIFLFSQYESVDKLKNILSGSPFHWLKDKDEAVKIVRMSTNSPPSIILSGLDSVWLLIASLVYFFTPKEIKVDLYQRLANLLFKTKEKKRTEDLLLADTLNKYADFIQKCRDLGEDPIDIIPPGVKKKSLPPALLEDRPRLSRQIEQHQDDLASRMPRRDLFKTVLLLRQEGLLTNKLGNQELANLLEILSENFGREYKSMISQTGKFKIDIEPDDPEDT